MKLYFLGDSITYGEYLNRNAVWTTLIQNERPNDTIINRGISGDTTEGMLARFQKEAVADTPDMIHIMGGANDIICGKTARDIQGNFMAMTQQAKFYGIQPVIGICPLPIVDDIIPAWKTFTDFNRVLHEMKILNEWLHSYVSVFANISIIDYEAALHKQCGENRKDLYIDGLHLNKQGNTVLAKTMLNFLET